jgi:hypothetical protein
MSGEAVPIAESRKIDAKAKIAVRSKCPSTFPTGARASDERASDAQGKTAGTRTPSP